MAAKYQATQTPQSDPGGAPQTPTEGVLLAGKYKTVEDLEKGYKELQSRLGQPKPTETPLTVDTEPANQGEGAPISTDVFAKAEAAYAETEDIPAEVRAELAKVGINDQFIDRYLAGVKAQEAEARSQAFELTGGEGNFKAMQEWIKTLPQADIDRYNKAVIDPNAWTLAIQGMYAKYTAAVGAEGTLVTTENAQTGTAGDVYRSKSEMVAAMSDPKYSKDPAYRAEVEAKVARSRTAGTLTGLSVAL
jgi:hypothetical protein